MSIGIIGGSGLNSFAGLRIREQLEVMTDWGRPSAPLYCGALGNTEVVFLARHGVNHQLPPHLINYRANIAALCSQGVKAIYAVNVVGGIHGEMGPGDLVIPDQLVDYTWGRDHTYSDNADRPLQHIDFTFPYDDSLRDRLLQAAIACGARVHAEAVYGATQGPRLETAAEIGRMANDGCDIVGMTGMPEAALARELQIPYACLALVVNMAAGLSDQLISQTQIESMMTGSMPLVCKVLTRALANPQH
ncbi:S-methyl-5'-thioinosine phosphorylase [Porticoccus sp.]|uniref:S-methyl-5'-thioinosine phosphorylase n=1 Tax=Porticoccus sp. TaxID=2024853 RepID=UPI003F6A3BEC